MYIHDSSESTSSGLTSTKSNTFKRRRKFLSIGVLGDKETGKYMYVQNFAGIDEKTRAEEESFDKITG